MEDPEEGYYAYNDFTKGLTMVKVVDADSYVCYLNPLNRNALTPKAMESYMEHHPDGEDLMSKDRDLPEYMPAKESISDRRFLSQYFREACEGFPIHWLIPASQQTNDTAVNRKTRDADDDQKCCCYECLICLICLICKICSIIG
ncbi:unnamed protein product [Owenia fusiformis]|uniref:BRICHOS domain-containing protein n=1 Tax=Owenia fusiformis TaxID=6347 RepID=A0A8S4NGX5_OWEFU|nr:unnamed protein product [Owenia fusiformis]